MKTLFLSPSYVCNEKCIFCLCALNARRYTPLTLEELCNAIDIAIEQESIEMVLISGGEPTIYRDIINLISYIKKKGLKFGDFFAGSGTTFEAVINLNKKDGGNRKCILVQKEENDIHQLCKQRINAVLQKNDLTQTEKITFHELKKK